ncbi:MAG: hypothetical protein KGJ80_18745 [Chloroflexota bacterium]|nr:hypothetical protein [Chloroflexota bacterium]
MSRWNSGQVFFALILIVFGALLLLSSWGLVALNWNLVWPVVLILFGLWLVWRAIFPGSRVRRGDASWGFGDYAPDLSGKEIRRETFSHGFGDLGLDLTRAVIPDGESVVRASHGFGDLTVTVPRDVSVRVHASAGFGGATLFGQHAGGIGPTLTFQSDDYANATRKLSIDASVGFGDVKIIRSQ